MYKNKKIVILGNAAVGKTSIVYRYMYDKFNNVLDTTIGAAFTSKLVLNNDGEKEKIEIWDTAGQERYRALVPMYYRDANAAIIVYDINNNDTITSAKNYIKQLENHGPKNIKIVIVGNKYDLNPDIKYDKIFNYKHYYCSAKTGLNIDEIFTWIVSNTCREKAKKDICDIHDKKEYLCC